MFSAIIFLENIQSSHVFFLGPGVFPVAVWEEMSCWMCSVLTRWAVSCLFFCWWIYWGLISLERENVSSSVYHIAIYWVAFVLLKGLGLHKWEAQEGSSVPGWCEYFISFKLLFFLWSLFPTPNGKSDWCLVETQNPISNFSCDSYTLIVWFCLLYLIIFLVIEKKRVHLWVFVFLYII